MSPFSLNVTKWILVQQIMKFQVYYEDDVIRILEGLIHISRLRTGHRMQNLVISKTLF
ncbi:hypothetical protein HanXRQr2_Chr03g0111391 [Helianthus annuus]|uniref:Uncharacterized protein n=1 Tax=Helianthus annuus TaxID=4232 RepID=A0A9K3JFZ4_HELAN|nr:hypothetical protein HanXRQr2_Chr03g0111391 [Helianthus annuus]KAJ0600857.1 hypothetical protein HanIR_Chr03g0121831 [Helianthus annuus]KAJ0943712.1 hypothetical protein HanPSC8_Chr03g0107861 [Helianthus annuus]